MQAQAERTALRIILSNVVAKLAAAHASDPMERREFLSRMQDECKLAANQAITVVPGDERSAFTGQVFTSLNDFYKGITIT